MIESRIADFSISALEPPFDNMKRAPYRFEPAMRKLQHINNIHQQKQSKENILQEIGQSKTIK